MWPFSRRTPHHPCLLLGGELGKHRDVLRKPPQLLVIQALQIRAQQDALHRQPHLPADGLGDFLVVPGEDFHRHAVRLQRLDSRLGGGLGRVQQRQKAQEHHALLIRHRELPHRGGVGLLGHGNHPHALAVQLVGFCQHPPTHLVLQGQHLAAALCPGAALQHLLHRALGDQLGFALLVLDHHAHPPPLEVKGDFVHLGVLLHQGLGAQLLLLLDDRQVNEVFQPRLEIAVEERVAQHPAVLLAVHVQVVLQHHLVLGEGAGLVRAKDVHGAQILDGVQVLEDDLLLAHGQGTLCQGGGDDHGQHFRGQAHRHRDGEQRRLHPVPLGKAVDEQHHRHHQQHKADEHPGNGS